MKQPRQERLARNEATFRALNESLDEKVHSKLAGAHSNLSGFVCECGDPGCVEIVRLELDRYEQIRQDPRLFVISHGHEIPEIEDVVQREDGFLIVRKHDNVAHVVKATDPRG